jgi:hypothetical protein
VRAFLPHLQAWQEAHDFPFEFSTEASINIADDAELLAQMRACGFFTIFVGIESPDLEALVAMKKKQNIRRSLTDSVQRIYDYGMMVSAGFIIGFDSETRSVAAPMADFIEQASIPVAMVGLLSALPNTQMTRRLISERRLHDGHDVHPDGRGDQCMQGLNFETVRARQEILEDYCQVLRRIYEPVAYCARVERLITRLKWSGKTQQEYAADNFRRRHGIESVRRIVAHFPEWRDLLWATFMRCYQANPSAVRQTVSLLALYLHLGPYARQAIAETERAIADIARGAYQHPPRLSPTLPTRPSLSHSPRTV